MCTMSNDINELAGALSKAQAEMTHAGKDAKNPHFKNDYATLASVLDSTRPILAKHGLSIMQPVSNDEAGNVVVETLILHASGQWMKSALACRPQKPDAQAMGSTITYLRRYSLASVCGIAQADDDGEAAGGRGAPAKGANPGMEPAKKTATKPPAEPHPATAADFAAMVGKEIRAAATVSDAGAVWKRHLGGINQLKADEPEMFDALVADAAAHRQTLEAQA